MSSFSDMTIKDFLDQASSSAPTPGGGGIAALAGALGGAMASMAANFTLGKAKYAGHEPYIRQLLGNLAPIIDDLRRSVDDDATAFSGIAGSYALPKAADEEKARRKAAVTAALTASMRVPLRVLRRSAEAAELLPDLARRGNANLLSDVEVAAVMLAAAARAALVNVRANSASLDSDEARAAEAEGERLKARTAAIADEVGTIIRENR
jgi:formiminotetrahydrofolate cyclodeaminase